MHIALQIEVHALFHTPDQLEAASMNIRNHGIALSPIAQVALLRTVSNT